MKTKPKQAAISEAKPAERSIQPSITLPVYNVASERPAWRWMLVLALGLVVLYFVTALPLSKTDPASRNSFALSAALATEQTSTIDRFVNSANGFFLSNNEGFSEAAYYQGHYYSTTAPGTSLLALPFYQFGRFTGELFATLSPASNAPNEAPAALGLLAMALAGAGTVLLFYGAARRLGAAMVSARYAALTLGLASALWREAGRFSPPVISMLLLTALLFLAFPHLPRELQAKGKTEERFSLARSSLIGLLLGLAIGVDYPNLIWTLLFLVYLLNTKHLRWVGFTGFAGGWLVGIVPLLLYNWSIFGVPWGFTYGYLLGYPEARNLSGQFFGGFSLVNFRQVLFGEGRGLLGPFLILFGIWGLVALYGQRGKRKETILLISLILVSLILSTLRRPVGEGVIRADFAVAILPCLAFGVAVWHERFQFLTRLEQSWLPGLALWGVALYYLVAWPGPLFNNLGGLVYLWPFALVLILIGLVWWAIRGLETERKGLALAVTVVLFTLLGLLFNDQPEVAAAVNLTSNSNNLLYNSELKCQGQKLPGWYLSEPCVSGPEGIKVGAKGQLQPYLIPVQGGKSYNLSLTMVARNVTVTWSWSDEGHITLPGEVSHSWKGSDSSIQVEDTRSAPPGANYLQLTIQSPDPATYKTAYFFDTRPRLEPMKNYATTALSFSFDWESAMGGLIHSKGGASFAEGGESGGVAVNESDRQRAVANAEDRGMAMRNGADNLLQFFQEFDIRGTFYATGYNLLDGNTQRLLFVGNPIYKWASTKNLWDNDYWTTHPWYEDDPFGTYQTDPAWYFGDQTDRLLAAGQDIQSHTFGHLYVRGTSITEFAADITTWVKYARAKGIEPRSFAFPWQSSNSLDKSDHFKILADNGFLSVTRLYDGDQGKQADGEGVLRYDNGKLNANHQRIYEPEAGPQNYYFYLNQIKNEPRLLSMNDYQLVPGDKSEAQAKSLIDQLLTRRGYGSIWTHPEAVVDPRDKNQWERVISYAASKRETGLWVDSVTNIIQQRLDIQKIGVETSDSRDGQRQRLTMTITNYNAHSVDGLTLTMPGKINQIFMANGQAYKDFKGAQFVAPKLEANQSLTLVVYLD